MAQMPRQVVVRIVADTRGLRAGLLRAELLYTRKWWRRWPLRLKLWRVKREKAPQ